MSKRHIDLTARQKIARAFGHSVVKTSDASVIVRGGGHVRRDGATRYYKLTCDSGASDDPREYKTVTGLSTAGFICLTYATGAVTASYQAEADATDTAGDRIPIAKLEYDGTSLKVTQLFRGLWERNVSEDAKSLNRDATGKLQWRGFNGAVGDDGTLFSYVSSLFGFQKHDGDKELLYVTLENMLSSLTDSDWGLQIGNYVAGLIALQDHNDLADIANGTAGDDHVDEARGSTVTGSNNVPYARLDAGGTATRNATHADMRIGDASNVPSIQPAGRKLHGDWAVIAEGAAAGTLGVAGRATVNDLTVTQAAVTVGGNVYTPISIDVDKADGSGIVTMEVLAKVAV